MFAAKARQAIARGHNTLSKADSIVEAIDNWESTELEKVEAKAKLLGSIFCVDHAHMKDQLLKANNVMAGSVVNLLVHNQKEARQVRMQESERKKRIAMEEQAKRSRQEKIRVQAKLEEKFQLIPKEEIMKIYEECDNDMEATIDELLYLVALTQAKMNEGEEKKRRAEKDELMRQSQRKEKERQEKKAKKEEKRRKKAARDGSLSEVKDDDAESEKAVIMDFIDSLSGTVSIEATPDVEEEDTPEKRNELATTLAHEQFESLTREEVEAVLAKHDFKLTEAVSASLLETSENKQVQVLLHAFDKEFEEWEIRDLLSDHDWDGAAVTVELNAKIGERKQKREEEQQKAEKERVAKALEAEQKQRSQATLVASKSDAQKQQEMEERKLQSAKRVTLRKVKKTENLGNHFEKQMRERQEAQAQQQQQNSAQQQQKFEGARQQLVKNLQGMFNPNMLMGGGPPPRGPPPRPPRPTGPAPMPEEEASDASKVSFNLAPSEPEKTPAAAATTNAPAATTADSEFVDHFLEVRKARAVGARGRRAPSRKPRGAATKDLTEPESDP